MEDYIFPFEKLEVWNLSVDFADYVLENLTTFPENKYFRLIGQMEAAVASVAQTLPREKVDRTTKNLFSIFILPKALFLKF